MKNLAFVVALVALLALTVFSDIVWLAPLAVLISLRIMFHFACKSVAEARKVSSEIILEDGTRV